MEPVAAENITVTSVDPPSQPFFANHVLFSVETETCGVQSDQNGGKSLN